MHSITRNGATALAAVALAGCAGMKTLDVNTALGAATQGAKALTLSDQDVKNVAHQAAAASDQENRIAPDSNPYSQRLQKIIGKHTAVDGATLNYKVYLTGDVNAFAMADGTVRVYSGLMDIMTDDELRFVIGHEIGHVVEGHSAEKMRVAYTAAAARAGVASAGGAAAQLAGSQFGDLAEVVINAQFSQSEELEADQFGFTFLKKNGYPPKAGPAALRKLAQGSGGHDTFLSSHPDPLDRAATLEKQL